MQDYIELKYINQEDDQFHYIRLGSFLEFIEKNIIYSVKNGNDSIPIIHFDYDEKSNIMYSHPYQISMDPTICVINKNINDINGRFYSFTGNKGEYFLRDILSQLQVNGTKNVYGQIMNIYVNMKFVLKKTEQLKNISTNKVVLIDFLNEILSSINGALGGGTSLEATIDEDTNTIIIRDINPLPNLERVIELLNTERTEKINTKSTTFELYGYDTKNGNQAGFIRDFNFTTEISPALSTTITVGSTANSTVVGENSTAFSRMNKGLTDRFKESIEEPIDNKQSKLQNDFFPNIDVLSKTYNQYKSLEDYFKQLSFPGAKIDGDPSVRKDILTNFMTYFEQLVNTKQFLINSGSFSPNTGFIPFNMSITMDGLSGMKIYNKFNIDTRYLPSNYHETSEFLIKSIEHKIEHNKWLTTLESVIISKGGDSE